MDIDGLPPESPELKLTRLLDEYNRALAARLREESISIQSAAALVTTHLQTWLFSSIEGLSPAPPRQARPKNSCGVRC